MLARHRGQTLRLSEHCGHVAICMQGNVTCVCVCMRVSYSNRGIAPKTHRARRGGCWRTGGYASSCITVRVHQNRPFDNPNEIIKIARHRTRPVFAGKAGTTPRVRRSVSHTTGWAASEAREAGFAHRLHETWGGGHPIEDRL